MNLKKFRYLGLLVIGLLAIGALVASNFAAQAGVPASLISANKGKISSSVLDATENGQSTSFVILLTSQADLSAAYGMKDEDARGWYVYNTLRSHADTTQAPLRAYLAAQGMPYQSYWAANMIIASGNRDAVEGVAARSDVRIIESNAPHRWIEDESIANISDAPVAPNAPEWGVSNVNAPAVWAMGYTGQGIVIGNQDTGMRWTHAAIKPQYRGWNGATADHNYNWHDSIHSGGGSCGANSAVPCDDSGHGTHTTGTTAGYDGGANQVGVAPGAKWIGCRNMDVGNGTPATYTECFQFFLAPTDLNGNNPNPALRPHVMNNSWGCPTSEGCAANSLQTIVESSQASGIFVEVSAGNSGSGCSSVDTPPAIYSASFSTGAYDITNTLAGFSSRGPVTVDGSNRRKPDISGPGVNVRSSLPTTDTSYGNYSGTSMAGPHVVGVVALLWSANPSYSRQITQTKTLLENTANPAVTVSNGSACGGTPIPNNHFGYGRVDALAAVNAAGTGGTATPTSAVPTATNTSVAATNTPVATSTTAPTNTNTPVATGTTAGTNTPGATSTPTTAVTSTSTATGSVAVPTDTPTTAPTETPGSGSPTATPVACTIEFEDVLPGNTFYATIHCLACQGIINGYPCGGDGEPCNGTNDPYFRPSNNITRGQLAKVVSQSAGYNEPVTGQDFEDVAPGTTFYDYIGRLVIHEVMGGYPCGVDPNEPCGNGNLPYFRPGANATRGQLTKIVSNAAGFSDPDPSTFTFTDVPPGSTFHLYVERLLINRPGVMGGYPCSAPAEPCDDQNRPYFRPSNTLTRGQTSKIVTNTFFPDCAVQSSDSSK